MTRGVERGRWGGRASLIKCQLHLLWPDVSFLLSLPPPPRQPFFIFSTSCFTFEAAVVVLPPSLCHLSRSSCPHSASASTLLYPPPSASFAFCFLATCNLFVMAPNDDECDLVWLRNSQLELELQLGTLPLALSLSLLLPLPLPVPVPVPVPRQLLQLPSDCLGQG